MEPDTAFSIVSKDLNNPNGSSINQYQEVQSNPATIQFYCRKKDQSRQNILESWAKISLTLNWKKS